MSREEFVTSWKNVRENTPSLGPHIGNYKAAVQHQHLASIFYKKSLISFKGGFAPKQYCKGLDVMIMKKAQLADIGKLRTIVLFDLEANRGFKWLGAFTMKRAIASGEIALE